VTYHFLFCWNQCTELLGEQLRNCVSTISVQNFVRTWIFKRWTFEEPIVLNAPFRLQILILRMFLMRKHHESEDGVLLRLQRKCILYWTGVWYIVYSNVLTWHDTLSVSINSKTQSNLITSHTAETKVHFKGMAKRDGWQCLRVQVWEFCLGLQYLIDSSVCPYEAHTNTLLHSLWTPGRGHSGAE